MRIKENKNVVRLLMLLLLLVLPCCAGTSNYMVKSEKPVEVNKEKAAVYFMRPLAFGVAVNFQIWDSDKFIGMAQAKSFLGYFCDPGKHLFIAIAGNKTFLPAELEAGKVYYVLTQIMIDELKEKVRLVPVKRNSEYWEKVKEWENELTFIKPVEVVIVSWENKKREEIKNVVNYYNSLFAEEKQKYQGLNANDGR